MPEQDRQPSFFSQDPGRDGVRCPICPGLIGASFQPDCVCCGRQVTATTQLDCKAEDHLSKSVKALSIKSEVSTQHVTQSVAVQENQPVHLDNNTPTCSKTSNGRQRRPILRSLDHQRLGSGGVLRKYQQPRYVRRGRGSSSSSSRRGTNGGAHHLFKGVRTRKGVKGFLVEIRPPKWKKTIWLGTYNSSIEAAGAYDAGVFYTKKPNTKYNLLSSSGAFPPLPHHLHLDRADNMDEIKLFVQNQAREAARRVGIMGSTTIDPQPSYHDHREACVEIMSPVAVLSDHSMDVEVPATSSESCITGDSTVLDLPTSTCMDSSSEVVQRLDGSEFQIPMDMDYLGRCLHAETAEETAENMFLDYTNYLSQQGSAAPDQSQQLLCEDEDEADVHHQLS